MTIMGSPLLQSGILILNGRWFPGGFLVVSKSKRVSNHILSIQRVPTFSSKYRPRLSRLSVGPCCEHEEGELVSAGAQ